MIIRSALDFEPARTAILDLLNTKQQIRLSDLLERVSKHSFLVYAALLQLLEEGKLYLIGTEKYVSVCTPRGLPAECKWIVGADNVKIKITGALKSERDRLASQEQQRQEQEIANQERAEREREAFELKQLQAGAAIDDEWTRHYSSRKQTLQQHAEKMRTTPDYSVLEAQRREFFKQQWSRLFAGQPLPAVVKAEFDV